MWNLPCLCSKFVKTRYLIALVVLGSISLFNAASQTRQTPQGENLPVDSSKASAGLLWRDPGEASTLDMFNGPAGTNGAPVPPFSFQEEQGGGTSAKVLVRDDNKRLWEVKWGEEVKAEPFAVRIAWAAGYYVEPSYYVSAGRLDNVGALGRASSMIDRSAGNSFHNARFELRDDHLQLTPTPGWRLDQNPFLGTNELQGLKIVAMLVSNWDLKDTRAPDGTNTAIMQFKPDTGTVELRYMVNDWGASMGKWGGITRRSKWDCKGYTSDNKLFIKGVHGDKVEFGYEGKLTHDVRNGVTVENVRWLMQRLGRLTDDQLRAAMKASGATEDETSCFVPAVRERLNRLSQIAGTTTASGGGASQ